MCYQIIDSEDSSSVLSQNIILVSIGAERRVECAQTWEQGTLSAKVEISFFYRKYRSPFNIHF